MATDVEIGRSLNALAVTLNDQRPERFDTARLQDIVTASLGGERHLHVVADTGDSAFIEDGDGNRVARVEMRAPDSWHVERLVFPEGGGVHATAAEGSEGEDEGGGEDGVLKRAARRLMDKP